MSVLVIGHRGARAVAPENTRAGMRRGLADGADGLEFDVRMLRDGHAAVMHDATVDRTTDGTGALAEKGHADVTGLDAGGSFADAFRGEPVPLLPEVLEEFLGRTRLALEMKDVLSADVLDSIGRAAAARPTASLRLASFQAAALQHARTRVPLLPRSLILPAGDPPPSEHVARALGLAGLFAPDADVDASYVDAVRTLGLELWIYTVNDPDRADRLAQLGVDAIITDDPALIRARIRAG